MNIVGTKLQITTSLAIFLFCFYPLFNLKSQTDCEIEKDHGQGFSTTISNVTENGNNSYTIVLNVKSNGCSGSCKAMAHYAVQASPGTYSDVYVTLISGNLNYNNIELGPDLGGDPFQGFRISGTAGFGNGQAGEFTITYTLSGGLQNQQALVKAGPKLLIVSFTDAEFQSFIDCNSSNIFPYYPPPTGGKLINSLIGPELTSLYNTYQATGSAVSDNIFQIVGATVLIKVFALNGEYNNLLATLTSVGYDMTDPKGIPGQLSITGWFPINNLLLINDLTTEVNYARPEYPAQVNSGIVTSQGDIAMRSDIARNAFLLDGEGIKVGVISDSYNKKIGNPANDDILKGDLPGIGTDPQGNLIPNPVNSINVDVVKDYPYTASDEGRAMLQIVHDIAPKAELAFRTGFINSFDFAQGILELRDAGCDIIVDDVTYISEPFFEDGMIAQTVNTVANDGVAYFSAAGNFGTNSYEEDFYPAPVPFGLTGLAHNFSGLGGNDIYQSITVAEGNYTLVLQWDDGTAYGNTSTDLDIYLANDNGSTLFGFNRDNTGGNPIEVLPFSVGPGGATTNLIIIKASGADNLRLKYIVFRGQLTMNEYANTGKSTIVGHPNAEGAITVGAVLYSNTPEYGVNPPTIASFSSRGGTAIDGIVRNKPDLTAPNGVNTTVDLGGLNIDGDPFPNFFGTSAAAPHAAGVAALIKQATNKFYGTNLQPEALRAIMTTTAIDMETSGHDYASGYGFIQADAALLTLANPSPVISDLIYDTALNPGTDTLLITVTGNYLTEGSQIIFNGLPLESATTLQGDTAIVAMIYPFTDLYPSVQVLNPPNPETNGTDGGLSNALYFSDKESVLVIIDSKSKAYGEVLPEFTANYAVVSPDGSITLEEAGLQPEELSRILNIQFEAVNVTELSNAGLWAITPDASDPLNFYSGIIASDSVDIALLDRFNFVFVNGLLTIDKLDLTIKPQDTTFVYGEPITGFNFDYIYNNNDSLSIPDNTNTQILSGLQASHATVLVNAMATALVNASATALVNYSFMISATALVNTTDLIEFAEVNDTLFNPDGTINATALVNGAAKATVLVNGAAKATVLVNATALVNASATALVNNSTINANSNSDAIIILTDDDIEILLGNAAGTVDLISMNLIPGNTVGTYWIVPGSYLTNNFNVTYEPYYYSIEPAQAAVTFNEESLVQIYNGMPKLVVASTGPELVDLIITYNGSTELPVQEGIYEVVATVNDQNYIGSATTTMTINAAQLTLSADDLGKIYGEVDPVLTYSITGGELFGEDAFTGGLVRETGEDATTYVISKGDLTAGDNYVITFMNGTFTINPALLTLSADNLSKTYGETDPYFSFNLTFGSLVGDDYFAGTLIRNPGEDVNDYSILQGTITAGNNYSITFESGIFSINQSLLTVTPDVLGKTYGEADPELTYQTTTGALVGEDGFNGALIREAGEDVNVYAVTQGTLTAGGNYFLTVETSSFNIIQAILTITPDILSKTYGETDPELSYQITAGALIGSDSFTGILEREPGEDVNTYVISQGTLSAGDNYNLSFISGVFTINHALITVMADNQSKTYGQSDPYLTYQITSGNLIYGDAFTGTLMREENENAGNYVIEQGSLTAGSNYVVTYISGIFTIDPAILIISAGTDFIFKGDPLPVYSFTFDSFVNGDDQTVLVDLNYSLSPNYNGQAGIYTVIPQATASNYSINTVNGTLYVNPFGPGTKHIIPKVICVDPLPAGSTYGYIATFQYKNNNNAAVYIPIGADNFFLGSGVYDASNQPELFLQGTNTFEVPFDGTELTWTVASYNHKGQKAAQGSSASSSSPSCTKSAEVENDFELITYTDEIKVYPNPVKDKVYIMLTEALAMVTSEEIRVFDLYGNICTVKGITATNGTVEIDLTGMSSGLYLVYIGTSETKEMLRIIKQ